MFDIIIKKFNEEVEDIKKNFNYQKSQMKQDDEFSYESKLKFNYRVNIISISALLEATLDNLFLEYLKEMNKRIKKYEELPKKIKNNHLKKSLILVQNLKTSKYQNICNEKEIITNLNKCFNNDNYRLNIHALHNRTGNYRFDVWKSVLIDLSIYEKENKLYEKLLLQHDIIMKQKGEFWKEQLKNFYSPLTDLSNYRNNIAHDSFLVEIVGIEKIEKILNVVIEIIILTNDSIQEILKAYE